MKPTVLRVALVVLLLVVQLATVVIVVMGMSNRTETQFESNAQTTLTQLSERIRERANEIMLPAERAVSEARKLMAAGLLDARSDSALERYFAIQLAALPQLSTMQLGRANGTLVQVSRAQDGFQSRIISVRDGSRNVSLTQLDNEQRRGRSWTNPKDSADPRNARWYEMGRAAPNIVWSEIGPHAAGYENGLGVAGTANYPDSTDAGVISASVELSTVTLAVTGLPLPDHGSLALMDDRGNALAYLSGESELGSAAGSGTLRAIENTIRTPLQKLLAAAQIPLVSETSPVEQWQESSGFEPFSVDGQGHYGLVTPLNLANGSVRWLLSVQAPATDFAGSLGELFGRKMRTLLAVILIPALIAALAVFGLTEPAIRPNTDSNTDELTGFLRREEFRRRLDGMLLNRRELEYGGRIVVVALEMDGFAQVNRRYGMETGNAVLRQFSRRLRARLRQYDLLGRSGNGEFVVALRVDRDADVLTTVNRIRRATVIKPFVTQTGRHLLGVTAGIACVDPNEGVDDLLARADQALITGKARHKNRSYLAADREAHWPQTGVELPDKMFEAEGLGKSELSDTTVHRAPTLEI